uniref:Uncharacterized protein n=1 Tax=Panagrolaimus superbus TaxID=310955 RepID=A0A914YTI0_9BILA
MTDAINEINNARNFLKGKFEIVRHIIDDLYVIKYPATLMHQRIFESFRVGKRAFNDFVIPKRKELMINKIYLVKQPSGIFSRVVIISFKNEVLLRIWFIDEDKYATVTLDKLRIADGFDELYPIYRPYILEIKVEDVSRKSPDFIWLANGFCSI